MTALALTNSTPASTGLQLATTALPVANERWIPLSRVCDLLGINEGTARRRCAGEWSRSNLARKMKDADGRMMWHVDVAADARLIRSHVAPAGAARSVASLLMELSEKQREMATKRAAALIRFRAWRSSSRVHTAKDFPAFAAALSRELGIKISRSQIYQWHSIAPSGDNAAAIAYALADRRGADSGTSRIPQIAWDFFENCVLTHRKWTIAKCYRTLVEAAKLNGWDIPSERRMHELVKEKISPATLTLYREGKAAWERKFKAPMEQNPDACSANGIWEADHMRFDFFAQRMVGGKLVGRRPWLTMWYDKRSRRIMGYCISWTPCGDTIRWALLHAIRNSPMGPPAEVWLDNGKDFAQAAHVGLTKREVRSVTARGGYWLDAAMGYGLFPMLGILPHFAEPYNHNGKGRIESRFGYIHTDFDANYASYCGSKPGMIDKDSLDLATAEARHLPTLQQVQKDFEQWVRAYNLRSEHHIDALTDDVTGQRLSPEEFMLTRATERRAMPDKEVLWLLEPRWTSALKVRKSGISVRVPRYGTLSYGDITRELERFKGGDERVFVTYDPDDMRQIRVFDARLRFVCEAPLNRRYGGTRRDAISIDDFKAGRAERRRQLDLAQQRPSLSTAMLSDVDLAVKMGRERQIKEGEHRLLTTGAKKVAADAPLKIARTSLDGEPARVKGAQQRRTDAPQQIDDEFNEPRLDLSRAAVRHVQGDELDDELPLTPLRMEFAAGDDQDEEEGCST